MNDELPIRIGVWQAIPWWVKIATILVALPAFIALIIGVFSGNANDSLILPAFGALATVALLQFVFVFHAYRRLDL